MADDSRGFSPVWSRSPVKLTGGQLSMGECSTVTPPRRRFEEMDRSYVSMDSVAGAIMTPPRRGKGSRSPTVICTTPKLVRRCTCSPSGESTMAGSISELKISLSMVSSVEDEEDDSSNCFGHRHEDDCPLGERTPDAPRRRVRRNWVSAMMNNQIEVLVKIFADEDEDINEEVRYEWLEWDPASLEVAESGYNDVAPILLAARWCSPKTIETLIKLGADVHATNHIGQNALSVLCSQPPSDMEFMAKIRPFTTPLEMSLDAFNLRRPLGFLASYHDEQEDLSALEEFATFRQNEMNIVAKMLLLHGVPSDRPDIYGRTAVDYAKLFKLSNIARTFEIAESLRIGFNKQPAKSPDIVNTPKQIIPDEVEDYSPSIISECNSCLPTGYQICPSVVASTATKRRGRRLSNTKIPQNDNFAHFPQATGRI